MLTKTVLLSSFAALALAEAAAQPRITQAPVRRQTFGDAGDKVDDLLDGAGSKAGDLIDGASSLLDGAGTKVDDLIDAASTFASGLGGDATKLGQCASAAKDLTDMPTPTGDLASAFASAAIDASSTPDVCQIGDDLPDDLKEDWESYKAEASKWYAKNSEAVSSAIKACPSQLDIEGTVKDLDCLTGGSSGGDGGDDDDDSGATRIAGIAAALAGAAVGAVAVLL